MDRLPSAGPAGSRDANLFIALALATVLWCAVIFLTQANQPVAILTAYVLPVPLAILAFLAHRMLISGPGVVPANVFIGGVAFSSGGAWFDMLCTVIFNPDLSLEANPIARTLLDSGHGCLFVLPYAVICESLLMLAIGLLWGALFSHRPVILAEVSRAQTATQFLKILTGQAKLSRWRWMFPLTHSHVPDMKFVAALTAIVLVAGSMYRWCLGIGWIMRGNGLDVPLTLEISLPISGIASGLVIYSVSTWRAAGLGATGHRGSMRQTGAIRCWREAPQPSPIP